MLNSLLIVTIIYLKYPKLFLLSLNVVFFSKVGRYVLSHSELNHMSGM